MAANKEPVHAPARISQRRVDRRTGYSESTAVMSRPGEARFTGFSRSPCSFAACSWSIP